MRPVLFALLLFPVGCGEEPTNPILEALRDSPCTVNELKELYRPGLSLVIARSAKGGTPEYTQQLVVDTDEKGFRYERYELKSPEDAVKAKTGKRLTRRTWDAELENIQCAGLPRTETVKVQAGEFECLVYHYKRNMGGIEMRFRAWFSVKHPGLRVLQESHAAGAVIRTELVRLRVPGG